MRSRLLWSFLVSAIINIVAWAWSGHFALLRNAEPQARETVATSISRVRMERRPPVPRLRPTPRVVARAATPKPLPLPATPAPVATTRRVAVAPRLHRRPKRAVPKQEQETPMLAPPPPATLALPQGWTRQDFGFLGTTNTAEWLDWKNQSPKWVPRVFVWRIEAEEGYMSRTTLHDAVAQVLSTLHDEGAKLYASRAQSVCSGQRAGWFLSYVKTEDDPPLHMEETMFMDGTTIYRATYVRAAEQQEDPKARAALNTLCV